MYSLKRAHDDNIKNKANHKNNTINKNMENKEQNINKNIKKFINTTNKIDKSKGMMKNITKNKNNQNSKCNDEVSSHSNRLQTNTDNIEQNDKRNLESFNNQGLLELIQEIKFQSEMIEKKYIEKNKNLKIKLKETNEKLEFYENFARIKTQENEELHLRLNFLLKSLKNNSTK
jgi:hypothetical protein